MGVIETPPSIPIKQRIKTALQEAAACKCCPKVECPKVNFGDNPPWTAAWNWWRGQKPKVKQLVCLSLGVLLLLAILLPLIGMLFSGSSPAAVPKPPAPAAAPAALPATPAAAAPASSGSNSWSWKWPSSSSSSDDAPPAPCPNGAGACPVCPPVSPIVQPAAAQMQAGTLSGCPVCPNCDALAPSSSSSSSSPRLRPHMPHGGCGKPVGDGGGLVSLVFSLVGGLLSLIGVCTVSMATVPRFAGPIFAAGSLDAFLWLLALGSGKPVLKAMRARDARWRRLVDEDGKPSAKGVVSGMADDAEDDRGVSGGGDGDGTGGNGTERAAGGDAGKDEKMKNVGGPATQPTTSATKAAAGTEDKKLDYDALYTQLQSVKQQLASVREATGEAAPEKWEAELGRKVDKGLKQAEKELNAIREAAGAEPLVPMTAPPPKPPLTPQASEPSALVAAFAKLAPAHVAKPPPPKPTPQEASSTTGPAEAEEESGLAAFFAKGGAK